MERWKGGAGFFTFKVDGSSRRDGACIDGSV